MNIIIFGGNFDPIHLGHINMAKRAALAYDATVFFVPSKVSVWKENSVSIDDKLNMLKIALEGQESLKIDTFELERPEKVVYSIKTVRHFKEKYPDDKLFFLMGADQADQFDKWNDAKELSELAKIIVYPRNGYKISYENRFLYNMEEIEGSLYESSSTEVRDLSCLLITPNVLNYILKHNLYFVPKVKSYYSKKRYDHALSVAWLSVEIAEANGLLFDSLFGYMFISAYLHDIGKDISEEYSDSVMATYFPEYINMPKYATHQFVGSQIAKDVFNINDEIILCAIRYHCTGRANMTILEKIIYAADKLDPLRGYDSSHLIKIMKEDYNNGFIEVLKANKEYLLSKGECISNALTDECFEFYLNK